MTTMVSTTMVSTLLRCLHRSGCVTVGCALVAATALLGGCTRTVDGAVHAALPEAGPVPPPTLAELLIGPDRFPVRYPAVVLDPVSVEQAIHDIDGVAAGAVVAPPECTPPAPGPAPQAAVAAQGVDSATSSSLTVALVRAASDLGLRRDQLAACPSFTTSAGEVTTTVTVSPLPAPPVDADTGYAVQQTVSDPAGSTSTTLILVAQIADVRVTAAWMTSGEDVSPNTEALDGVFTDAVLKVRRGGAP